MMCTLRWAWREAQGVSICRDARLHGRWLKCVRACAYLLLLIACLGL